MRSTLVGVITVLCAAMAGCTSSPSATASAPPGPPSQAPTSVAPTPTPTPRTKAQDTADLKKALIKATDLGKPWVQPKKVSTVQGKKGEICPGHVSAVDKVPFTAEAAADLTEGAGAGRNIASYRLHTLPDEDDSALVAAYAADQKACARYTDAAGFTVRRSVEGPTTFDGADPVASWAERIYYDKQRKKLAYARHTVVIRQGRVVTYLSYAFLTVKKDPAAKSFTRASRLVAKQQTKNAAVFG